jgi:methylated-DNA-protein-cysteine methyltransferase-like protein
MKQKSFFEQVYRLVSHIPRGRVASYGQIARMLGYGHAARSVGWAMQGLPEGSRVPWHRVVNAQGFISIPRPDGAAEQRCRLEAEGVQFDAGGRIDLALYGWDGLPEFEVQRVLAEDEDHE